MDEAIDRNADITSEIVDLALRYFGLEGITPDKWRNTATSSNLQEARLGIKHLYRDWSAEGAVERELCYQPVLKALDDFTFTGQTRSSIKVLIPGAGLGRLMYEVSRRGYTVEANEISYSQILTCMWALDSATTGRQKDFYPFMSDFSNVSGRKHQMKAVKVPDVSCVTQDQIVDPRTYEAAHGKMTLTPSDFLVLYRDGAHFRAYSVVITVFFLDTAPNVIRYIETIRHCLEENGIWINLGPLQWHFAQRDSGQSSCNDAGVTEMQGKENLDHHPSSRNTGIEEPGSVELSYEELSSLVQHMGFDIEVEKILGQEMGYLQDPSSMAHHQYNSIFWVARKKTTA